MATGDVDPALSEVMWMDTLIQARREGQLLICEVVYAELAPAFATRKQLESMLGSVGARLDPVSEQAAWQAGNAFKAYRKARGARKHLIPDFLIAAHAQTQADRRAAIGRGYFRRYFSKLVLLRPSD